MQRAHAFWASKNPEARADQSISTHAYNQIRLEDHLYTWEEDENRDLQMVPKSQEEQERLRSSGNYIEGLVSSGAIRKRHETWRQAHLDAGLPWTIERKRETRELDPLKPAAEVLVPDLLTGDAREAIASMRVQGRLFEEIAEAVGMTREQVRQILRDLRIS